MNSSLSRRSILTAGLGVGVGLTVGSTLAGADAWATEPAPQGSRALPGDPFTLGIASGDPSPDGFVLWTRLALDPLADNGFGGMPGRDLVVSWQISDEPSFRRVVRAGAATARADAAHSVHVEVAGLDPRRDYWYRFRQGRHLSAVGRTRTAPAVTDGGPVALALASCSHWEEGLFTAYGHLATEPVDAVLHLGDYIYEYAPNPKNPVRQHVGQESRDLAGYRLRHALYKTDQDLQAAHAAAPWIVTWDDHDIDNDWAGTEPGVPEPGFMARRAAAAQAYYENMPLRRTSVPSGPDIQLYRRLRYGGLVNLHMLDTRQYRDDQACGGGGQAGCEARLDPARTILGDAQEAWTLAGMAASDARWDVLGQQVFFTQRDVTAGPVQTVSMDTWDGYVASRQRLLDGIAVRDVENLVVFTGDIHRHFMSEITTNFDDPDARRVGVEVVTTSISSGGNGADRDSTTDTYLRENPHLKFVNSQRGYAVTRFTDERMHTDFRIVPYVDTPGAPVSTRASFVVESGESVAHRVGA